MTLLASWRARIWKGGVGSVVRRTRLGRSLATGESETADLFEAVVPTVADDDVIEQWDPEHVSGCCEPTSDVEIVWRWRRIAAWVIVAGDDGGGMSQERSGEHFARVDQHGIERAAANLVIRDHLMFRRQAQDREYFRGFEQTHDVGHIEQPIRGVRSLLV